MRAAAGIVLALGLLAGGTSAARAKEYSHQKYFEHYQGTKTCLKCHKKAAESFFHSQHYQWKGEAPDIVNAGGRKLGKLNTINDFCTNPAANWIDIIRNSRGEILSKGCSACHAGLGLRPSQQMTREQLENIDCLICHASGYRRDLYPDGKGGLVWKPILWKNQEGMDSVSKRISLPQRTMCLRCHAGSGGGPNWKRGDIEYTLRDCQPDFDVHMASSGNDMECLDCHAGEDHRVRGRGTDLSGTDAPDNPLRCTSCHDEKPHGIAVVDRHTSRVYCTSCHIPDFARDKPTDMVRDWSKPFYVAESDKYRATITFGQNVKPVYAWYNGKTWEQLLSEPIQPRTDGTVGIMLPQGSRNDPTARIYAFKLHRAKLPVLDGKHWLIPIVVEEFFADGDMDKAVKGAARLTYGVENAKYHWVDTVRYLGIFHEVRPASKALGCLECHSPDGRMDWKALGYDGDPLEKLVAGKGAD